MMARARKPIRRDGGVAGRHVGVQAIRQPWDTNIPAST
jgi:hypothetical protein